MKSDPKNQPTDERKPMDTEHGATLDVSMIAGKRRAYAIETLVDEVRSVDDGVQFVSSDPDEYGVDLTVLVIGADEDLTEILLTLEPDVEPRIAHIYETDDADVSITVEGQAYMKDDRTAFGIAAAYRVAQGDDE